MVVFPTTIWLDKQSCRNTFDGTQPIVLAHTRSTTSNYHSAECYELLYYVNKCVYTHTQSCTLNKNHVAQLRPNKYI